jgi:limonene-1,2-epoxide hydrolase
MSNTATVLQFFTAVEARDRDAVLAFFAPDAVYHNIPLEPRTGHDAIWQELAQVLDLCDDVNWVVHTIAEDADGRVLTERSDRFHIKGGGWAEFKVMGIFELRDGRIHRWRDYFDLQQGMAAIGAASGS